MKIKSKIFNWLMTKSNNETAMRIGVNYFADDQQRANATGSSSSGQPAKRDLNQPAKEADPGRNKKIAWTFIGVIVGAAVIAGLVVAYWDFTTPPFQVTNVSAGTNADGTSNNTVVLTSSTGATQTINSSSSVSFYFNSSTDNVMADFGTYYVNVHIVDQTIGVYEDGTVQSNTTTDSNGVTTTTYTASGSVTNLFATWATFANVLINTSTGNAYTQLTLDTTTSGTTSSSSAWVYNDSITTSLPTAFRGLTSSLGPSPTGFDTSGFISTLIPILIIVVIIYFFARNMKAMQGAGGQDSVFSIGKSQAKIAQSQVRFSDVAGIEEEKSELIEVVDYLKRPERYAAMGARVPKGVILYGPPGTGKTLLAKAVAGEAGVPFFQVSGSAFEDMLVGVGAKRVRDLFNKAVKAAPAIIFIDEIDSVGSKRGKFETTAGSLADQTLNQLLAEMDGFNTRTGVIVMAATNRLDVLDDALLRPGRFDRHIQVSLPDIKERTAILKIHSRNKNLSSAVDLEDVARRTPGFSGAQLENVLNEATLLAVRKNKKVITIEDLDEAIDRVIAGPAKKTRVMSAEERKQIAYHEAGHAIVGLYTPGSEVVQKITIIPRGQAAGYTLSVPEIQELAIQKKSDLLGMVAGLLGGRASEELTFGKESISTGIANDIYKATNIVRAMVTQLGMSDIGMAQYYPSEGTSNPYQSRLFSENTAEVIDKEIEKIFKERYAYACKIVKENKKELDLIVESLLLLETIVKPQIDFIHKYKQLPQEAVEKKKELEAKKAAAKASQPTTTPATTQATKPTTSTDAKAPAKPDTTKDPKKS